MPIWIRWVSRASVGGTSSADKLIGTPGTTANAITVGSYDWNDRFDRQHQLVSLVSASSHTAELMKIGQRSNDSSPGYRRLYPADKTVKPDIVTPRSMVHGQCRRKRGSLQVARYDRLLSGVQRHECGDSIYGGRCCIAFAKKSPAHHARH